MNTSSSDAWEQMETRVAQLERSNRRLRASFFAMAAGAGLLLLMGAGAPPDALTVKSMTVEELLLKSGNTTAVIKPRFGSLEIAVDGGPTYSFSSVGDFIVHNRETQTTVRLASDQSGGQISVYARRPAVARVPGRPTLAQPLPELVALIDCTEAGGRFAVRGKDGKVAGSFLAATHGGMLDLSDSKGTDVLQVGAEETGGFLRVAGPNGKTQVEAACNGDGGYSSYVSKAGMRIAGLGADSQGGGLFLNNLSGKTVAQMGAWGPGGEIILRNNLGKDVAAIGVNNEKGNFQLFDPATRLLLFHAP